MMIYLSTKTVVFNVTGLEGEATLGEQAEDNLLLAPISENKEIKMR